jgi:hypothetical protein
MPAFLAERDVLLDDLHRELLAAPAAAPTTRSQ